MGSTKAFFYDFKGIPGFKEDFMGLVQAFFLSNLCKEMQKRFLIKNILTCMHFGGFHLQLYHFLLVYQFNSRMVALVYSLCIYKWLVCLFWVLHRKECSFYTSDNLTIFNIIRWVDRLMNQASDGSTIILIDWK